ncbi:hypothetical protein EB796_005408 [Bugula neritina]|uniref:Uncharacterized protein n=1 Tax=Bugula neritina TaxID=10212 RepID=A0A7J7KED2_BUGNE|nr:hypothetical protein EB796_005408 [Bugula neritina]
MYNLRSCIFLPFANQLNSKIFCSIIMTMLSYVCYIAIIITLNYTALPQDILFLYYLLSTYFLFQFLIHIV